MNVEPVYVTMKSYFKYLFFGILLISLIGCVYSFTGANLGELKTVAVPMFDNLTAEPGIREKVTTGLTQGILDDNNLRIADFKSADAVLSGKITQVDDIVFAFEGSGNQFTTSDYKITITAIIKFENRREKKTMWEETFSGWGRYALTGTRKRSDGMEDAIKMLTQNVINKVTSDW